MCHRGQVAMKVLIVSGGIGSGKSTVCRMLENDYGIPVYEADKRVKELYIECPLLLQDIESLLGGSFRNESGDFHPSLLAARIFSDSDALQRVESVVFPVLMDDFARWKEIHADKEYVALESATILEKPALSGIGDLTIVVDAPLEVRVDRAAARNGTSRESVLERARSQKLMNSISDGHVPASVDYVLKNEGDMCELSENLRKCMGLYGITKVLL